MDKPDDGRTDPGGRAGDWHAHVLARMLYAGGIGFALGASFSAGGPAYVVWIFFGLGACVALIGAAIDWRCRRGRERTSFLFGAANICAILSCFLPPLYVPAWVLRRKVVPQIKALLPEEDVRRNLRTMTIAFVAPLVFWAFLGTVFALTAARYGW